ncbi:MAG: methyltransferase domain-containing protein [Bacteroidetes bacterium]|nr:methyltransferase domain-containing protein [Bacteroidota bacterium]
MILTTSLPSINELVEQLELLAPNPLNYDSLCRWVESWDWLALDWQSALPHIEDPSDYARNILCLEPFEVVMLHWPPGVESAVHHHQGFWGTVVCLKGTLENVSYRLTGTQLERVDLLRAYPGGIVPEPDGTLHKIRNGSATEALVTLHFYYPALETLDGLALYDLETGSRYVCNEKAPTASMNLPRDCYRSMEENAFQFKPIVASSHVQCNVVPKPASAVIEKMVSNYFDEQAAVYDAQDAQVLKRKQYTQTIDLKVAACFQALHVDQPVKQVMHMACGTGRRAQGIQAQSGLDYAMHGVDLSEEMAKQATARGVNTRVGSLSSISPVLDGPSFDAVTLLYAYGHLPDEANRLKVLSSAYQMLRPGGILIFDAFDIADEHEWGPAALAQFEHQRLASQGYEVGDVFYRRNQGEEQAFLHYCTKDGLSALVQKAGFTIREMITVGYDDVSGEQAAHGKLFVVAQR